MKVYVVHNYSEPEAAFSSKEKAALHIFETRSGGDTRQIVELYVDDFEIPAKSSGHRLWWRAGDLNLHAGSANSCDQSGLAAGASAAWRR